MKRLLLASNNRHKLGEFSAFFSGLGLEILTPIDLGLNFQVEENGTSFSENAKIKSSALFGLTGVPAIADDSGICVEFLGGEPGIHSARFGGDGLTDRDRAMLLLEKMDGTQNRKAWFECVIAFTDKSGTRFFSGKCDGLITEDYDETGSAFGYDPVFYYPPLQQRFSQLPPGEKNKVSHRGLALTKLRDYLATFSL